MFAPAEKTRLFALVSTTTRTVGCSNRIRCSASYNSMSTPRSYEFSFRRYPGRSPPPSSTSRVSVATAPATSSFQWRYRDGSVRESTGVSAPVAAPSAIVLLGRSRQIDPHGLRLGVVVERVHSHLAAEAALLVAAERRRRVIHVVRIHPHGAGLQPRGDDVRLLDVSGPDARCQAVLAVVG